MCHEIIPGWYRSATAEQLGTGGHVSLVQRSAKQSPWSYRRPGLESPGGAVQRRLASSVPERYGHSPADPCQRKEACWGYVTSGGAPQGCRYPASGRWPASRADPLPFWRWGNVGRASQAPWLPHPSLDGSLESWESQLRSHQSLSNTLLTEPSFTSNFLFMYSFLL